jgi:hypothetical protein
MTLVPAFPRALLAGAIALVAQPIVGTVQAAQADIDLLYTYIGEWRGRGMATYRDTGESESILCRMTIQRSASTKVSFVGRCSMAGGGVTITGSVGFSDANNRYEAIATTASYQGQAIGRRRGDGIQFTMTQTNPDDGSTLEIDMALALNDAEIAVDFGVLNPEDGWGLDADVPFEKQD